MPNYKEMYQMMLNSVTEAERLAVQSAEMAIESAHLANVAAKILLETLKDCENPFSE